MIGIGAVAARFGRDVEASFARIAASSPGPTCLREAAGRLRRHDRRYH